MARHNAISGIENKKLCHNPQYNILPCFLFALHQPLKSENLPSHIFIVRMQLEFNNLHFTQPIFAALVKSLN